jgi:biotin transporter BioY
VLPFLPGDFLKMVLTVILYERLIPLLANIKR